MEPTNAKAKLDKSDFYNISLILLFSLYVYFFMDTIFTVGDIEPLNSIQSPGFNILTIILPVAFLGLVFYNYFSNRIALNSYLGFTLNKTCWVQLGIVSVLSISLILNGKTLPPISTLIITFSILFNILVAEIIYRAVLIDFILKSFSRFKHNNGIAITFSGLCFFMIYNLYGNFNYIALFGFIATAHIYYVYRNLFFVIFWDAFMLIPRVDSSLETVNLERSLVNSTEGINVAFVAIFFLLYFAIAIPIHFIQKKNRKETYYKPKTKL